MLRPTKHTDLDHSLVAVAALVLKRLQLKKVEDFSILRGLVRKNSFQDDVLIVPALCFLFSLGLIEYRPKADIFEYRGPR